MGRTTDFIVVGGGIIGLAVARQLLIEDATRTVVVFEKEAVSTAHASGRNSGVLHAGFYYSPDSLKAQLTRRGNALLQDFCDEHGVAVRRCGKVVVTRSADELPGLQTLYSRGVANGVDVRLIDESELAELEPLARTCQKALWSPTTSVVSPEAVVGALAADLVRRGGRLEYDTKVVAARPGEVLVTGGPGGGAPERWSCGHIVNSAGLFADRVADWFGMCDDYRIVPFKGVYRYGNWPKGKLTRHVYPVPDPRNPFLGVHTTVTVEGRTKIGPTAIPAFSRENYSGVSGVSPEGLLDVAGGLSKFLGSQEQDALELIRTELPKYSRNVLAREAARLVPSIKAADFAERGRAGIRAQLVNRKTGALEMDFLVRGDADSTHVLNAVSPAFTSSLAFAEHVVGGMAM